MAKHQIIDLRYIDPLRVRQENVQRLHKHFPLASVFKIEVKHQEKINNLSCACAVKTTFKAAQNFVKDAKFLLCYRHAIQ